MKRAPAGFIWDNLLAMTAYWICSGAIISSLTEYFGFSLAVSNFITGFTGTLPIFQLAGGLAYGHTHNPLQFLRLSNVIWRIFFPLAFFAVLMPHWLGAPVMLISYTLGVAIYQFSAPSQISWMSSCVDKQVSASYYSTREMIFMAGYTALFCTVSLTIDWANRSNQLQLGFTVIAIILALLMAGSLVVLYKLPAPPVPPKKAPALKSLLEPLYHKGFNKVMTTNMLWCIANMFIGGFSAVYQVRILNISFFQIMLWMTVANICRTIFTPVMAKFARRIGWKAITSLSFVVMAGGAVIWMLSTPQNAFYTFPVATIVTVIPYAAMNVGFLKLQIANSPEESRSVFISVLSLLNGGAALVGSLLCSTLIEILEGYSIDFLRYLFGFGVVFAIISAILSLRIPYHEE